MTKFLLGVAVGVAATCAFLEKFGTWLMDDDGAWMTESYTPFASHWEDRT